MSDGGWIGVDLDGTLARDDNWKGIKHVGKPIPAMVERVKAWLKHGYEVRIFTARVSAKEPIASEARAVIQEWCQKHIGRKLQVTNVKDFAMRQLWDDRAVQVVHNEGIAVQELHEQ